MTLAHERTSQFFEKTRRERRNIVTPEGVPIPVALADHSERFTAFALDWVIWTLLLLAIYVPLLLVAGFGSFTLIAISIALFIGFVVRNIYFVYFEIAWRGATPGKRIVGIRVVDRAGGPLLPSAVIARNLTREVEMFLPLGILLSGGKSAGGGVDLMQLSIGVWLVFFAALPLINRDRMRGGDLIAGTMVIALPKLTLLSDLVERAAQFTFTEQQLRAYGAFELQVLEELLRRPPTPAGAVVLREVCDKICHRIGWTSEVPQNQLVTFLRDFYTAERAFLERGQLYGKVRADKFTPPALPT
ncbi:MAG: RDD family protein [Xanthobacteraceae bacterium]|jgi:uncharacterized RDD family membrane protein YckC